MVDKVVWRGESGCGSADPWIRRVPWDGAAPLFFFLTAEFGGNNPAAGGLAIGHELHGEVVSTADDLHGARECRMIRSGVCANGGGLGHTIEAYSADALQTPHGEWVDEVKRPPPSAGAGRGRPPGAAATAANATKKRRECSFEQSYGARVRNRSWGQGRPVDGPP